MKMTQTAILFILIFSITACSSKKQFSISQFLEQSGRKQLPAQNEFPDDGAVFLYENTDSKIFFDDKWMPSTEKTYHSAILYFNDKAKHYLTPVIYLDKKDELVSFWGKTIKPNGEIIKLTWDDLHQISLNTADFTDNKSFKFTFAGIEPGCVIEYKYSVKKTRSSIHSQLWEIQSDIPKLFTRYSIEFPQNFLSAGYGWNFLPVNINLSAPKVKNRTRESGMLNYGTSTYYWELKDIPALYYEPKMPPYDDIAQYLKVDLQYKNWDELTKKYWEKIKEKFQSNSEIRKLSKKLVGASTSEQAKIDSISSYLQRNYRYISSDIDDSGLIPHDAEEIIRNKYGDCKDMSVLGIVLLKSIGIEAYPALVKTNTNGKLRDAIVNFDFNHMIIYAKTIDNKEYWLDATGSSCVLGETYPSIEGTTPLVIFNDGSSEFKKIPMSKSHQNLFFRHLKVYIDSSGVITGNAKMIFKGNHNLALRSSLKSFSNSEMEKMIQRYAKLNLAEVTIDSLQYDDPQLLEKSFNISFNFECNTCFSGNDKLFVLNPSLFEMDSELKKFLDTDRSHPVQFTTPEKRKDLIEVYYDNDSFEIESIPSEIVAQFKMGLFIFKGSNITAGKIVFDRDCTIKETFIAPENYSAVTKLRQALTRSENQSLVLRKL